MATIADLLGEKAQDVRRRTGAPAPVRPCADAMHYVATGLPGSPYKRDRNGRLRKDGKFAPAPVTR